MTLDDLRGRVTEVHVNRVELLVKVMCRAATLKGDAVDFEFTLGMDDDRIAALHPGTRVFYSTKGTVGVWGAAKVIGTEQWIPVDGVSSARTSSYREALAYEGAPTVKVVERLKAEASRMGFEVQFGVDRVAPFVEVHVPGRGKMKYYKDAASTWGDVLADAGLGDTI